MDTPTLLEKAEIFVRQLFTLADTQSLLYHNLDHTLEVVKRTQEIADYEKLSIHSNFVVIAAAWFHDTGLITGDYPLHEERSVLLMKAFFADKNIGTSTIENIAQVILATNKKTTPSSQLEKILCDADTWYTGTSEFHQLDTLAWEETMTALKADIQKQLTTSLDFLLSHQFYTDYCNRKLSEGKKKNIDLVKILLLRTYGNVEKQNNV